MDPSNSSEILPSDHVATIPEMTTNLQEASDAGYECPSGMDRKLFRAAKRGDIQALQRHGDNLHQMLTATKNTVLHIYIACVTFSGPQQAQEAARIVGQILEMCPPLLLQPNERGDTALHIAAKHGRVGIVKVLIETAKARHGDLENGLEEAWPRLIRTTNKEGDTSLHEAVCFNHPYVVEILTKEDPEFSYPANVAGETPLFLAAERAQIGTCYLILRFCTNPTYQGPNGRTCLHAVVNRGCEGLKSTPEREERVLVDEKPEQNMSEIKALPAPESFTPKMTRMLLQRNKELTKAVDEQGCTPLHLAASVGVTSIVKELLKHDKSAAYVREKEKGGTALHFAAYNGHKDVVEELIKQCPDSCELVDHKGQNILHYAIQNHLFNSNILENRWLSNVLLNAKDDNGDTPLHHVLYDIGPGSGGAMVQLASNAQCDKMAFNKKNQNALDLVRLKHDYFLRTPQGRTFEKKLRCSGARPGCRIVKKDDVAKTVQKNGRDETMNGTHLVVASLIATVSFAAGIAVPGGFQDDAGPEQGTAILTKSAAFQAFVVTNTIAMTVSSCAVLLNLLSSMFHKYKFLATSTVQMVQMFTALALIAMVIAYITGTYAILGHSPGLGITACVLGSLLFFGLTEVFMINDGRKAKRGLMLLPFWILSAVAQVLMFQMVAARDRILQRLGWIPEAGGGRCFRAMILPRRHGEMEIYDRC